MSTLAVAAAALIGGPFVAPAQAAPSVPSGLAVGTPTATSLTASWTAVSGATSYTATAYDASSGGTAVSTCTASPGTTTSCVISSLSNATQYWVAVNATDGTGTSADSARETGTTSTTTPSAPNGVSVTGSDGALLVSWSAPTSTGGAAITGYTAEAWSASSGGSVVESCTTSTTTCTISPLTNGTTYYVSVYATNSVGDGTSSSRLASAPGSLPGVPRSATTSRGDGRITVTWLAPSSEGSSSITSYTARARLSRSSSADVVASCSTSALSCTISGVTNSSIYYVSVTATNAVGEGGPSSFTTVSAVGAPGAPTSVTATAGNGYAAVSWSAPTSTGGSTIEQYVVRAYHQAQGGDAIASCEPNPVSARKCNLGPLPNGGTYYVDVTARNALLTGEPSAPRVSVITGALPDQPRNVVAVQEGVDIRVRWQTPAADGGRPITRYTARAYASSTTTTVAASCTTSGDTCLITGVEGYYYVDVVATTGAGTGSASEPRVRVFVIGAADAPRAVAASQNGRTLKISWLRPLDDSGVPVQIYEARAVDSATQEARSCKVYNPEVPKDASPWTHRFSCAITGLTAGSTYNVTVSGANTVSVVSSTVITVKQKEGVPSKPRDVAILPGDDVIAGAALLPQSLGGSGPVTLRLRAWSKKAEGTVVSFCTVTLGKDDSFQLCQLTGLSNFEPYWIDSAAGNSLGWSKATERVQAEPAPQKPTAPLDFRVRQKGTGFLATWEPPIFDGGFPIRRYIVRVTNKASGGDIVSTCIAKAPQTTCDIKDLPDTQYLWFSVTAENTVGESPTSPQVDRTT